MGTNKGKGMNEEEIRKIPDKNKIDTNSIKFVIFVTILMAGEGAVIYLRTIRSTPAVIDRKSVV